MAKQPVRFKCFIPLTRSAVTLPGSTDSLKLKLIFPEESVKPLLPLVYALRNHLFKMLLTPADLDEENTQGAENDLPFESLASISPSASAIKISGRGGMVIQFDLQLPEISQLMKLREKLLLMEIQEPI